MTALTATFAAAVMILSAGPAGATDIGVSTGTCAPGDWTKCVTGAAYSESAGTSTTGLKAAVLCGGAATRSSIIAIECSTDYGTATSSFDGTAGAVPMVQVPDSIARLQVCWEVTGSFTDPFGPTVVVVDRGCTTVSL